MNITEQNARDILGGIPIEYDPEYVEQHPNLVPDYESGPATEAVLVYPRGPIFIERFTDQAAKNLGGKFYLIIGNEEWTDDNLFKLEVILARWVQSEYHEEAK